MKSSTYTSVAASAKAILVSCLLGILVIGMPSPAMAQSKKYYLMPELALGLTSGYKYTSGIGLDFGTPGYSVRGELKAGKFLNNNVSVFTGIGFSSYHYTMLIGNTSENTLHDTVRDQQSQHLIEIPIGIRYATFNGRKQFKTRYYIGGGLRACILNDGRFDYHTVDKAGKGYDLREEDFNRFTVRLFVEGGLDIPMDYNSAIIIGLFINDGLTRNMSKEGTLANNNYGVFTYGGSFGLRIGL
jgi:hypothetical protein